MPCSTVYRRCYWRTPGTWSTPRTVAEPEALPDGTLSFETACYPSLVIVMFGLNDAAMVDGGPIARTEPRVPLASFVENLRRIVTAIAQHGGKVLLCTPTPMSRQYAYADIGAYAQNEDINFQVRGYALALRMLAADLQTPLLDTFRLFDDAPGGLQLIEDGCHPYVQGHAMIADAMIGPVRQLLHGE